MMGLNVYDSWTVIEQRNKVTACRQHHAADRFSASGAATLDKLSEIFKTENYLKIFQFPL